MSYLDKVAILSLVGLVVIGLVISLAFLNTGGT
jgi:hypothetical protein